MRHAQQRSSPLPSNQGKVPDNQQEDPDYQDPGLPSESLSESAPDFSGKLAEALICPHFNTSHCERKTEDDETDKNGVGGRQNFRGRHP